MKKRFFTEDDCFMLMDPKNPDGEPWRVIPLNDANMKLEGKVIIDESELRRLKQVNQELLEAAQFHRYGEINRNASLRPASDVIEKWGLPID